MTHLENLTHFSDLLSTVKQLVDTYNYNLRNELFEIEDGENYEDAYQRGEAIFDCCEDNLRNLLEILNHKNELMQLFKNQKKMLIWLVKKYFKMDKKLFWQFKKILQKLLKIVARS